MRESVKDVAFPSPADKQVPRRMHSLVLGLTDLQQVGGLQASRRAPLIRWYIPK
jgi:hypothetical protein